MINQTNSHGRINPEIGKAILCTNLIHMESEYPLAILLYYIAKY